MHALEDFIGYMSCGSGHGSVRLCCGYGFCCGHFGLYLWIFRFALWMMGGIGRPMDVQTWVKKTKIQPMKCQNPEMEPIEVLGGQGDMDSGACMIPRLGNQTCAPHSHRAPARLITQGYFCLLLYFGCRGLSQQPPPPIFRSGHSPFRPSTFIYSLSIDLDHFNFKFVDVLDIF